MGKQPYHLTDFIIILDKKVNKSNKFCICKCCVLGSLYNDAMNNKFANTQELVRCYLKNCIYFKQAYSESEQAKILKKSNKLNRKNSQKSSDNNTFSDISSSLLKNSTFTSNQQFSNKKHTINRYCLQPLSKDQQKQFEQLLLQVTVSCSSAFSWIDNPEIKAFFKFLHPLVKLPSQKDLSSQILEKSAQKINISIQEAALKDTNGVTLAYNKDISNERTRWFDVQCKTEDMLNNLNKKGIKVNAIVTDCASQYEAAKTHAALKNLATKIEEDNDKDLNDFPEILLTYISNNESWNNLMQLKSLLEPYMASLNKLQQDKSCLSDILHSFSWIYKQNIAILVEENDEQTSLDEDTEEEQLISLSENDMDLENPKKQIWTNVSHFNIVKSINNWNAIVNQWVSLNEEEEVEDDLNESESLSELYFNEVEFHPVDDFTAK
ncbi:17363_t:CDS:2 [Cetraspora pellucida]|uniref:17363_t:CDS:1 n=1 Tax=Cetraspora pellucida TaxID=1433469 RepID=A0A9N9NDC2_9GLOM|nr:17363_t:CDS:2 [Cetraspora pellucida]